MSSCRLPSCSSGQIQYSTASRQIGHLLHTHVPWILLPYIDLPHFWQSVGEGGPILLCKGKLTNAWGLGGLSKHHSKLLYILFSSICNKSVKNCGLYQGYLVSILPWVNWRYKILRNNQVAITDVIEP